MMRICKKGHLCSSKDCESCGAHADRVSGENRPTVSGKCAKHLARISAKQANALRERWRAARLSAIKREARRG